MNNYHTVTYNFYNPVTVGKSTEYTCRNCNTKSCFKNATLYAAVKRQSQMKCKTCPIIPEDFRRGDAYNTICCLYCPLVYKFTKRAKYFQCYCQLNTKQSEHTLYQALSQQGFVLSREECPLPGLSNHKVDIVAETPDAKYFIEVDGGSHFSTVQREKDEAFQQLFLANVGDQPHFLIRIYNTQVDNPISLQRFVDNLWNWRIQGVKFALAENVTNAPF